ncbi:MAG: ABC transporter permease, partial [Clostridia bacterium]|nr:ABC transporter permease [Clostridia bacterium]
TGLPFKDKNNVLDSHAKAVYLRNYASSLSMTEKANAYIDLMSTPSEEDVQLFVSGRLEGLTRSDIEDFMVNALTGQTGMDSATIRSYISGMSDEEITSLCSTALGEQYRAQYAENVKQTLSNLQPEELALALESIVNVLSDDECAKLYDSLLSFSDSSYEENLLALGKVDIASPSGVRLYASSFANKDVIEDAINDYNNSVDEIKQIKYTDYIGIMMSSITTIINAITYVLIAFVAVSLIVSSIMIGVITLISVQERTKEIGILRAIGASKKNVSSMFNAETVIIGFASGLIGVLITYLLCLPINLILHMLTKLGNLSAYLPPLAALILIAISVLLTLIAGIIPSRSAAKKDPVVALRTE